MPPYSARDEAIGFDLDTANTHWLDDHTNTSNRSLLIQDFKLEPIPEDADAIIRRSVTFDQRVEIYDIPHVNDMSEEEKRDVWMSRKESNEFRRECLDIVSLLDCGMILLTDEICIRGLTTAKNSRLQQARQNAIYDLVYDLQEEWEEVDYSWVGEQIEQRYRKFAPQSENEARKIALVDAEEVRPKSTLCQ
jgi:hypothetical protein